MKGKASMKKRGALLITGFLCIASGAVISYGPLQEYWQGKQVATALEIPFAEAVAANAPTPSTESSKEESGKPSRVQIPSLGIDLSVAEGRYNENAKTWTLSKDKAHYAVNTPELNNTGGNTFIYGHNRKEVFQKLTRIKKGAEIVVIAKNGKQFIYHFANAYETHPNDDSLFKYEGAPILTLQTCSGMWFQNRQLFTFTFTEVR